MTNFEETLDALQKLDLSESTVFKTKPNLVQILWNLTTSGETIKQALTVF